MNEFQTSDLAPDLAWAAYLLSGWWQGDTPAPTSVPAHRVEALALDVVERLRRNGVPLLTLAADPRPAVAGLLASAPLQEALAVDRRRMAGQQAALAEIAAAWRADHIPALFVKALGPQPTFPYVSNNLDVLAPHAQQHAARKIVRDMGFVELRHIEEPNKFLLRRYHLGVSAFDIHIHGRLEWHVEFLDTRAVWARSVLAPDTRLAAIPAPEDGVLIALAHALYENKALKLIELAKVIYAARVLQVDWDRIAQGAQAKGWLDGLWFALALCDRWEARLYGTRSLPPPICHRAWDQIAPQARDHLEGLLAGAPRAPIPIGFLFSKRLFYGKMLADPTSSLAVRSQEVLSHTLYGTRVRLRMRSQRPFLVALDGLDGSGKSAHAALFERALDGAALRGRVVWARGGGSAWLRPLLALGKAVLGRRRERGTLAASAPDLPAGREAARADLFTHPVVRALWPWLIALELGVLYQWRVRRLLLRGEVVVADRYVLSALMELGARVGRPDIARTLPGRLLRWLAPKPDRTYLFDLTPELALARKEGQESIEFLAQQAALLPALAAELGAVRVNSADSLAEISDRIITHALQSYLDTHRTLLNGLFWANPRPLPASWRARDNASREVS